MVIVIRLLFRRVRRRNPQINLLSTGSKLWHHAEHCVGCVDAYGPARNRGICMKSRAATTQRTDDDDTRLTGLCPIDCEEPPANGAALQKSRSTRVAISPSTRSGRFAASRLKLALFEAQRLVERGARSS